MEALKAPVGATALVLLEAELLQMQKLLQSVQASVRSKGKTFTGISSLFRTVSVHLYTMVLMMGRIIKELE